MPLVASTTLKKARFFLDHARASSADRDSQTSFLEAAVVFSRSVTFHLQKELSGNSAFAVWYEHQQKRLKGIPVSRYLMEQRNYVLKEGPLPTRRTIVVVLTEAIAISSSFSARVIRASPWYRRSPAILWQDAMRPLREWHRRRTALRAKNTSALQERKDAGTVRYLLHFDEPEWAQTTAIDLISQHLDILSEVVSEAERRFMSRD